jgi:iron complex outermembrane receptor protein
MGGSRPRIEAISMTQKWSGAGGDPMTGITESTHTHARSGRQLFRTFSNGCSGLAVAACLTVLATPATAQVQQESPAEAEAPEVQTPTTEGRPPQGQVPGEVEATTGDEEAAIVVTGSRLATGFVAPTPVTAIAEEAIERRAAATLGEVLDQIPSFRTSDSPSTWGVTSRGGAQINPDLRGLGASRTLVLVDGRRHVPTESSGSVDIKLIPTLLVEQVEVVTGGASAAYGSDAVSGVVNFILKDRIEGIHGTVQFGISEQGDGQEYRGSLASGFTFGGDRGRFVAGFDYLKIEGVGTQITRDWGRKEVGLITNPNFATNGLPNFIIAEDVRSAITTPGGLIVSGPLRGIAFGPNGTTYQYNFGQVFGSTMIGGSGQYDNENVLALLGTPLESLNGMAKLEYDISDAIEVFGEVSFGFSEVLGATQENRDRGNLVIRRDNAFLPESVRAAMVTNNLQTITIGRVSNDVGKIQLDRDGELLRGVIGAKGKLGGDWTWDAYYQHGEYDFSLEMGPNNRRQDEFRLAVDAVRNGNGQIVCRSTLTNPSNGCIPVNVFGNGSLVVNDYVFGSALFNLNTKQDAFAANVQGTPFSTWAGPVAFAAGAEYRKDRVVGTSDDVSQRVNPNGSIGGWILGNQLPFSGTVKVWEAYAEGLVPLLADVPFGNELNVSGAVRRTHYSTSGTVYTWKVGGTYKPHEDVRFRVTRSRDIRAPNIAELYERGGSSNTNVFDPVLGQSIQIRELNQGNPELKPEIANTLTAGVVFQPSFIPRLAMSVDYYDIQLKDAIDTIGAPSLAQGCFAGNQLYCESITFNADGTIAFITNSRLNLASVDTSGFDLELSYGFRPEWLGGDIRLRALATRVTELKYTNPNGEQNRLGQVSDVNRTYGVPKWAGNFSVDYDAERWNLGLQARLIGPGKFSTIYTEGAGAALTVNDNKVPAYVYLTLTSSYEFELANGRSVQLFGVVNNLTDTDPPFLPSGAAGGARESSTNPVFYNVIGRYFRIGARFKL